MEEIRDTIEELHNTEWLSVVLERFSLGPGRAFAVFLVLNLVVDLTAALRFDAWSTRGQSIGLSTEASAWTIDIIMFPAIIASFAWLQSSVSRLFRNLIVEEGAIPRNSVDLSHYEKGS